MGFVFLFTSDPDFNVFFKGRMLVGFYGYCFQRVGFFKGYDSVKRDRIFGFHFSPFISGVDIAFLLM